MYVCAIWITCACCLAAGLNKHGCNVGLSAPTRPVGRRNTYILVDLQTAGGHSDASGALVVAPSLQIESSYSVWQIIVHWHRSGAFVKFES